MPEIVVCASSTNDAHDKCVQQVLTEFENKIRVFTDEYLFRDFFKTAQGTNYSIWVIGGREISAINIAAALVSDGFNQEINLVVDEITGSLVSRASNLGITSIVNISDFCHAVKALLDAGPAGLAASNDICDAAISETCANTSSACISVVADAVKGTDSEITTLDNSKKLNAFTVKDFSNGSDSVMDISSFVLSIMATSGGSGKSTIAALASYLSARKGYKTLCLDLDLQFGDISQLCGIELPTTLDDLLENSELLRSLSQSQTDGLPVMIAPPARLERGEVVNRFLGQIVIDSAQYFDVIIVNTGAVWMDCHAQLLELSDKSVFVVDQRASSVRSTRHALELCSRLGISRSDFVFLLNRCSRSSAFTSTDISCALDGGLVYEVKDGGVAVEEYLGAGHAEDLACSKNEMSTSLSEALEKIYETSAKIIALQRQSQLGKANPIDAIDANGSREVKSRRRGLLRKSNERRRSAVVCDAYHKDECNSTEAFQWA